MKSAEEMRSNLTEKAAMDLSFRKQLMADPKGVVQHEFGITVPDNIEIVVHESDKNTIHLSIPPGEMEEEQLEAIAAGRCCC